MNELNNSDNLDYSAPPRSFIEAIKVCFAKYAVFKGRASRSEFWWFALAQLLCNSALGIGVGIVTLPMIEASNAIGLMLAALVQMILALALLVPYYAVGVRRFHDTNRNGAGFVTLVTVIIMSMIELEFDFGNGVGSRMLITICSVLVICFCSLRGKKQKNEYNLPTDVGREITR